MNNISPINVNDILKSTTGGCLWGGGTHDRSTKVCVEHKTLKAIILFNMSTMPTSDINLLAKCCKQCFCPQSEVLSMYTASTHEAHAQSLGIYVRTVVGILSEGDIDTITRKQLLAGCSAVLFLLRSTDFTALDEVGRLY